jgi:hypothetical protein
VGAADETESVSSWSVLVVRPAVAVAVALVMTAVCAPAPAAAPVPRSTLLAVTPLGGHSRAEVAEVVRTVTGAAVGADVVRWGVESHRLTYRTITPDGAPTTASALLVLPAGDGGAPLGIVSETHGTVAHRDHAPSTGDEASDVGALLYASGGRAVVVPDYLGLGTGPGPHPYLDTASSVTASLDALGAARSAAAGLGRRLTADVYLTGFSQGGHVAMVLGSALLGGAAPPLRPRALAPAAGPYDLMGEQVPGLTDGRVDGPSGVYYLAYFLVAQDRLRPLYDDPREVFRAPYAAYVAGLFDGEHTAEEIAARLPGTVEELLTEKWYALLRAPAGPLAAAVRRNDGVCDWRPAGVPVRLHTSAGDRDVPAGNAASCARSLAAHGVTAEVVDHGDTDHIGTYWRAIVSNAHWFARLDAAAGLTRAAPPASR